MQDERASVCFLCTRPLEPVVGGGDFEADFESCVDCSLVYRKKRSQLSPEREHAFYQTHKNDLFDPGYRRFLSKVTDPLRAILSPGARGLDFGSGPAPALALVMSEAGHETAIYDPLFAPDEKALEQTYEFVTCTEVVEHFREPARDWARLFSLVGQGGVLAVMTEWYRGQCPLSGWRYARDPTHCVLYSQNALRRLGEQYRAQVVFPSDNVTFFRV